SRISICGTVEWRIGRAESDTVTVVSAANAVVVVSIGIAESRELRFGGGTRPYLAQFRSVYVDAILDVGIDKVVIEIMDVEPERNNACLRRPWRILLIVVLCVHHEAGTYLLQVTDARRLARLLSRLSEHWKQDCRENCDYGDDHKQFDKSER